MLVHLPTGRNILLSLGIESDMIWPYHLEFTLNSPQASSWWSSGEGLVVKRVF